MNSHLKVFFDSFKLNSKLFYTFVIDAFTFIFITLMLLGLGELLKWQSLVISQGKTPEELKVMLLSGTVESSQAFLSQIKLLLFFLIFGLLLFLILALLIFSLSRALIWLKLFNKKFSWKKYWSWNLMTIVLTFLALIYLVFYGIARIVLNIFVLMGGEKTYLVIKYSTFGFFLFSFIILMFLVYYSFAEKGVVWHSVGNAFVLLGKYWSRLWKMFILILLTWLVLQGVVFLIQN